MNANQVSIMKRTMLSKFAADICSRRCIILAVLLDRLAQYGKILNHDFNIRLDLWSRYINIEDIIFGRASIKVIEAPVIRYRIRIGATSNFTASR